MQVKYNGALNFYFPCEIIDKRVVVCRKKWENTRSSQRAEIKIEHRPDTELFDSEKYRDVAETDLIWLWKQFFEKKDKTYAPYATYSIRKSYRGLREDMLFSKNVSAVISSFMMSCEEETFNNKGVLGDVILNVNVENGIGVFVICLQINDLTIREIEYIKHTAYKRLSFQLKNSEEDQYKVTTFQHYLCDLKYRLPFAIDNVDYRARYSFLELYGANNLIRNIEDYYGLLNADESYESVNDFNLSKAFSQNIFHHCTRGYYVSKTNALVLHELEGGLDTYCKDKPEKRKMSQMEENSDNTRNNFREICNRNRYSGHISILDESYIKLDNVAGTKNNLFPEYLRAIELHYLFDCTLSSEIVLQKRSAMKFWIFIPRALKLWRIIYDKAINKYHINESLMDAFDNNKNMALIKEEYNSLMQMILNFIMIMISILTLFTTIISIKCN